MSTYENSKCPQQDVLQSHKIFIIITLFHMIYFIIWSRIFTKCPRLCCSNNKSCWLNLWVTCMTHYMWNLSHACSPTLLSSASVKSHLHRKFMKLSGHNPLIISKERSVHLTFNHISRVLVIFFWYPANFKKILSLRGCP